MHKWKLWLAFVFLTALLAFSVCAADDLAEYDGYILKFKNEESKIQALELISRSATLAGDAGLAELDEPENLYKTYDESLIAELESMGLVEYSEPDAIGYLFDYDYNLDKYYASSQSTWAHACSNALGAWRYGAYGNGVKVAVIDSGVKGDHEDLVGRVSEGASFVTNSPANVPVIGHGTAVAGVIAAAANGKGVVGVAHRAEIVPIKITDENRFATSLVYLGIDQAVKMGVDVINLSLGTTSDSIALRNAVNKAINAGIIVVAASGNTSSYSQGSLVYPGYYNNVVNVGNLMRSNGSFVISSGSIANSGVTIAAPGTSVYTTSSNSVSSYGTWSGTSFASPYVAGIAALAKSVDPDITQAEFMELLIATAKKDVLNGATKTNEYGYGIADAGALIEALIAKKAKGGFISPIDKTVTGEVNVKIYNPGSTLTNFTFIAKSDPNGRPLDFFSNDYSLNPGEVVEIPLSGLNGSWNFEVSCYLFDKFKFKPVYKKISA